jgi:hypothetical protein
MFDVYVYLMTHGTFTLGAAIVALAAVTALLAFRK